MESLKLTDSFLDELSENGKPKNKRYLELNLPPYLQKDINALIRGRENGVSYLDCLLDELYGSINSAMWDEEISAEQAAYLRERYLFSVAEEDADE